MQTDEKLTAGSSKQEFEELIKSEAKLNDSCVSYTTSVNSTVNSSSIDDYHVKITNIYLCSLFISPIMHILDIGTDSYLAYQYYVHREYWYFLSTTIFVVVPALICTVFSIRMYFRDTERVSYLKWTFRCVLMILQISPVIRYFEALQHALVLRRQENTSTEYKEHATLLLKEDSNLALLRILECFLEASPQQVLQITILLTPGRPYYVPTKLQIYLYMSLLMSFLSTSWTFAMYHRSIRFAQENKMKMKWVATLIQFFRIFFLMTARSLAISEAASVYPLGTLTVCFIHWLAMTIWLSVFERTWFCFSATEPDSGANEFKEILFCVVMGLVYIFSYVAVNDEPNRYKYILYYSVHLLENCLSIVVWMLESSNTGTWLFWLLPTTVCSMFVLGMVMMLVYYLYFHPSKRYERQFMSLPDVALSPPVEKKNEFRSYHSDLEYIMNVRILS